MSKFTDLLEDIERENSSGAAEGNVYSRLMSNARPMQSAYPTIDTRDVQPVKEGGDDFSILDALSAGTGRALEHLGTGINEAFRPENMTPSEWKKHQSQLFRDATEYLQSTGSAMAERNHHQYEDNSVPYHLQNIFESLPESLAIMGGAYAAGAPVGGLLGGTGKALIRGAEMLPGGLRAVENLYRAYNAATPAAKVARFVTPSSARALATAELGAIPEAYIEQLEAEKRYVERAKQNGTYVPDQTEMDAKDPGKNVFLGNVGVISAFNIPEYGLMFGKGGGLKTKAGRALLASLLEGGEEVAQEAVSANALDEPLDPRAVRDSFIAGAGTGMGMHVAGRGAGYIGDRIAGRPTEDEIEKLQEEFKQFRKDNSQKVADSYHEARDSIPEIARQAYRDAADERIYWGNGGKDEGKTWFKQGDNVSLNGAQPDLMNAIDSLADWLYKKTGRRLVVTSGTNGDHPSNSSEHGHSSGWKVDVVDEYTDGEDSDLITADFQKGKLADEFIAYGRSLGLGMNFEDAGSDNVHFDVALDGTQWDGNGEDAGGFRGGGKQGTRTEQETGGKKSSSIDNFMRAIVQQESGGDYDLTNPDSGAAGAFQIMPENWSAWAQDAGLPADAPMTSENQNIVARHKMLEYYNKFGNWRDVAIAWYGGEGAVSYSEEAKARPQYSNGQEYPSINEYADSVMSHFENFGGEQEQSVQSRADEIFKQRFQDRMNPSQQQQRIPEPEPIKTRYVDTRAEDDATQKLFDQFAQERLAKSVESKNVDEVSFWSRMFNDDGTFNNTKENRDAIREHYGEDLSQFIAKTFDAAETPQEQPAQTQQGKPQPKPVQTTPQGNKSNSVLRDNPVITAGNKYLEELRATGKQDDAHKAFQLLSALQKGDAVEVENILKKNGREDLIQQAQQESQTQSAQQEQQPAQTQENVVQNNTTPENVLARRDAAIGDMRQTIAALKQKLNGVSNPETKMMLNGQISHLEGGVEALEEASGNREFGGKPDVAKIAKVLEEYGYGDKSSTTESETQSHTKEQGEQKTEQQSKQKPKNAPETGLEKAIKAAHGELKNSSKEKRTRIGKALTFIADNYGVEIPQAEREALREKGDGKLIQKWREELMYRGHLPPKSAIKKGKQDTPAQQQQQPQQAQTQPAQETPQQPSLIEQARAIVKEATDAAQKNWDEIKQGYKERGITKRAEQDVGNEVNDIDDMLFRDDETAEQEERQTQADLNLAEKQANELAGLQSRQAEEKRNAEERQRQDAEREKEMAQRESLPNDISNALAPASSNNVARQKQGNAIADLISSKPFQDMYGTIQLPKGLEQSLRRGDKDAIKTAQQLMQRRNVRPVEWTAPDNPEPIELVDDSESEKSPQTEIQTPYQPKHAENVITHPEPEHVPQLDADSELAIAPVARNPREAKAQGAAILRLINSPQFKAAYGNIKLSDALQRALRDGKAKGIEEAQRLLAERGIESPSTQKKPSLEDNIATALKPMEESENARRQQGTHILSLTKLPEFKNAYGDVEISPALERALKDGRAKGIEVAQGLIKDKLRQARRQVQAKAEPQAQKQTETKPQVETTQAEQPRSGEATQIHTWGDAVARAKQSQAKPTEQPRQEPKPEPKAEEKPKEEPKPETKQEPQEKSEPEPKPEPKAEQKPQKTKPETESKAKEGTPQEKPKTQEPEEKAQEEKTTPQEFSEELAQIEKNVEDEEFDPSAARWGITQFASALKKHLIKNTFLGKYPNVLADVFDKIDDALLDAMAKNKKTFTEVNFGYKEKDGKARIDNVRQFRKWCENMFDQVYRASDDEAWLKKKNNELAPPTPAKRGDMSVEDITSPNESATNKTVLKLADRLKRLLDDRLKLESRFPNGRERLFGQIDKVAKRVGDNVSKFKAYCRELLGDANSGRLEAGLQEDEPPQGRSRPKNSSKAKKDPQAGAKAKERAEKLKADILALFNDRLKQGYLTDKRRSPTLDDYPLFKADLFETIDKGVEIAGKSGHLQPFVKWCSDTFNSLKELAQKKNPKTVRTPYGQKTPLEKWLDNKESSIANLTKQKPKEDVAPKETMEEPKEGKQDETTEKTPTEKDRPAEKDNTKDAESGQVEEEVAKPKAEEKAEPKEEAKPKQKKLEDVKDFDELETYFKEKHGAKVDPRVKSLDFEIVKEFLTGVEKVFAAFPRFAKRIHHIGIWNARQTSVAAHCTYGRFRKDMAIELNPRLFSSQAKSEFVKAIARNAEEGLLAGSTVESTGVHEAAHAIHALANVKNGYRFWTNSSNSAIAKRLVQWAYNQIKKLLDNKSLRYASTSISKYASRKPIETIAEAVSDVFSNGDNAQPLSKAIFKALKKYIETDELFAPVILGDDGVLHYYKELSTDAFYKAFKAHHAGANTVRGLSALQDRGLAHILETADTSTWEEILKAHIPDEKVMASTDEWTDARIAEAMKIVDVEQALAQLGATIDGNGKVKFSNDASRNACVNHLKNIETPDFKLMETKSDESEEQQSYEVTDVVNPEDLTPVQKALADFSNSIGCPIVFFRGEKNFHGKHQNGISYINVNSPFSHQFVYWHEFGHWLKNNQPELFNAMVEAAGITAEQIEEKRATRTALLTDEDIKEEIICDAMKDAATREGLLNLIGKKDKSLLERIVSWAKGMLDRFTDWFHKPDRGLTTTQQKAMQAAFSKMIRSLKDANGKPIFRVSNSTGDIEVIGGRTLQTTNPSPAAKYSIDNSDNSTSTLRQWIKNDIETITRWVKGDQKVNPNKKITDILSEATGYKILYGYTGKNEPDIVIDDKQKIIKSRHHYDWENLLPAVGSKIASNLQLDPTEEMSDYITKWLMTGALNDTSPEANKFKQAMLDNPAEAVHLQDVRDTFKEMADMSAYDAIASTIVSEQKGKSVGEWLGGIFNKEQWVDDLNPLKTLQENMLAKATPEVAEIIKKDFDIYEAGRLLRGSGGLAELMIGKKGMTDKDLTQLRAIMQAQNPLVDFENWKPLSMIVDDAGGDAEGLEVFSLAKLDKEIHEKKRELDDKGNPKYPDLIPSYSEAQCDEVIRAGEAKFGKAHEELVNFSNTLLAMQYRAGLISQQQFFKYVNGWENYVPAARVFDEYEEFNFVDSFKKKKGSKLSTYSPLKTIAANTDKFIRDIERNKLKLEVAMMTRFGGFGDIIAEEPVSGANQKRVIHFKENGKMKYLITPDESIVRAIESTYSPADSNVVMRALKGATTIMRTAQTVKNPDFIVGNFFRDIVDAYIHNKHLKIGKPTDVITTLMDVWRAGFKSVWKQDADYKEFFAYGGAQSGFISEGGQSVERAIEGLGKKKKGFIPFFKRMWGKLEAFAEASENLTRVNTYKSAKAKLVEENGGVVTEKIKRQAALAARSASVDFARAGKSMRAVNQVVLFSNAAVQGLALWGETFNPVKLYKSKEARKEAFSKLFKAIMMGVFPALIQSALNYSDDDRRKKYENRPDWEKEVYWILGDGLRIPKGMDVGIRVLSALTDEFADYLAHKDPIAWGRVLKQIKGGFPSMTSTIFTPALETYMNYSIFRDAPIVPKGELDRPAHAQYGLNSSPVAKALGEVIDVSPRKIDYLIANYGGFMAKVFTGGASEIPMLRRFYFDPEKNPKVVRDYYETLEEQDEMFREYKFEREQGKKAELPEEYKPRLHKSLKSVRTALTKLSKLEKQIIDSPKLTEEQREAKLKKLEERRVELCRRAFERAQ